MDRTQGTTTAGTAALAICEATLIALTDLGIISGREERALLVDAAESHRAAVRNSPEDAAMHRRVAAKIQQLIDGRASVWNVA